MGTEIRLADRSLTLRLRRNAFVRDADKQRAADAAKAFLADAFSWTRDDALMQEFCSLLGLDGERPAHAVFKIRRAIETGDIVAIPDPPRYTGTGSAGSSNPKPPVATFTPSQLFKGASRIASAGSFVSPSLSMLPANDWLSIWNANPGDVLPDGRIATPLAGFADTARTDLGSAQPFGYAPDDVTGDVQALAGGEGTPRGNQAQNRQFKAVVRALGLDQDQAQELHREISGQGLGYHEVLERAIDLFGGRND
ncbi:hypothetical protein ACFQ3P_37005 [Paraburkholderia sabiae]|uniref:Uncharacterized protein n=1 Tax=Paraburkholderia sabiae TaxID=273251 RepID=A0ABU9QNR5_9BURK|nr:hypothetical protein [Paraburkholderia sabiae]WJZ73135.1 hypothetical protein QEN71_23745 [Paraburkholderia sabiae]CAD6562094.1 hypothetical protein LMG24235_07538 [Paraburkholderia sabiae]